MLTKTSKPEIAVWFSCGAASAVAAKLAIAGYGDRFNVRILNNPVIEEGEDNRRFCRDVEKWLGRPIEIVTNSKYPATSAVDVWNRRKVMSTPYGAPCTVHLKKEARQQWEKKNPLVEWHVMGFTFEEKKRHDRFVLGERGNLIPILISAEFTKQNCADYLAQNGIKLPEAYGLGYPNANCRGCVMATSPTYWNFVRKVDPEVFIERSEQSRRLGAKLVRVKGKRIYLDELAPNARGRPLKSMVMPDCGVFCEEK